MEEYKENVNNNTNTLELHISNSNQQRKIDIQIITSIFAALSLMIDENNFINIPEMIDNLINLFFINPKEFVELFCLNNYSEVIITLLYTLIQDNTWEKTPIFTTIFSFLELITEDKEICMILDESEIFSLLSDYLLLGNCASESFLNVIKNLSAIKCNSIEFISWILHVAETINKKYIDSALSLLSLAIETKFVEETGIFSILMFLIHLLEANQSDQSLKYYDLLHKILIKYPFVIQSMQVSRIIRIIIKGLNCANISIKILSFDMISKALSLLSKENAIILANFIKRESIISGLLSDNIELIISVCNFLSKNDFILESLIEEIISENIIQCLSQQIESSSYETKESIFNFLSKVFLYSKHDIQNMILNHMDFQFVIDFCANSQYSEKVNNIYGFFYLVLKKFPNIRDNIDVDDLLDIEIPDQAENNFLILINDLFNDNQ